MNNRTLFLGLIIVCILIVGVIVFLPGQVTDSNRLANSQLGTPNTSLPKQSATPTIPKSDNTAPTPASPGNTAVVEEPSNEPIMEEANAGHRVVQESGEPIFPTPYAPEAGTIVGRVIDANGNPLASANLRMQSAEGVWSKDVLADYAGRFKVLDPPDKPVSIKAYLDGYRDDGEGSKTVKPNQSAEVVLTLIAQGYSISGKVIHRDTNAPVEGMMIKVVAQSEDGQSQSATTDAQGNYTISDVVPGSYTVFGSAAGNTQASIPPEQNGRQVIVKSHNLVNINFEAVTSLQIQGIVQSMQGQPVAQVEVTLQQKGAPSTTTDSQGKFQYQAPPGAILIASHPQYGNGISDPVQSANVEEQKILTITLQSPGSIFGYVRTQDGKKIEAVSVALIETARGVRYETETNAEGIYSFDDIPLLTIGEKQETQTHKIQFEKSGYGSKIGDVMLYPGEITTHDVELISTSTITGTVKDSAQNALPDVRIRAFDKGGNAVETASDNAGLFSISVAPDQSYTMQFDLNSTPKLCKTLFDIPAGQAGVNAVLDTQEWVISGTVSSSNAEQPVKAFTIMADGTVNNAKFTQNRSYNSPGGGFQFLINEPGTYLIRCMAEGFAPAEQTITVNESSERTIPLSMTLQPEQARGSITGTFVPSEGIQLTEIELVGRKREPTQGNDFFIHNLPAGNYNVILYIQGKNDRFSRPAGSLSNINVLRNQETNVGQVDLSSLVPIILE